MDRGGLNDLERAEVALASPDGRWIYLGGPARHRVSYAPGFLFDLENRTSRSLGGMIRGFVRGGFDDLAFSADGRRAVWKHLSWKHFGTTTAWSIDLSSDAPPLELGGIAYETVHALSPSGRRLRESGSRLEVMTAEFSTGIPRVEDLLRSEDPPAAISRRAAPPVVA
jgi:hypothetical protein